MFSLDLFLIASVKDTKKPIGLRMYLFKKVKR